MEGYIEVGTMVTVTYGEYQGERGETLGDYGGYCLVRLDNYGDVFLNNDMLEEW